MSIEIYKTEKISSHIWRISELNIANCYLVVGEKKAALIDCGLGVSSLLEEVRKITSLPIILIATHSHVDHVGGAKEFGKIHVHYADAPILRWSNSFSQRIDFLKTHKLVEKFKEEGIVLPHYKPYLFMIPFGDTKIFDLGGVKLETIRTKGHSIGSCNFKVKADNIILVGDNFIPFLLLQYAYASSLKKWVEGCEILFKKMDNCVLYGGHGKNPVSFDGLKWQYENAKKIIASTAKNDSKSDKKIVTLQNEEHEHLIIRYRTDKIL